MEEIYFFGYGLLGVSCLTRLVDSGYKIRYVFTHKDLSEDGVDSFCTKFDISFSYADLRKKDFLDVFDDADESFLISVNYRYIIPKIIFNKSKYAFNIHGSLLPLYRGRTPHVWSIINGEKNAGVSAHIIEETVDTGDIIEQVSIPIEKNDTGASLVEKMTNLYPDIVVAALKKLKRNESLLSQDNVKASYFGKRTPIMGYIDFYNSFYRINNFVRAQAEPYPGAYCFDNFGTKIIVNSIEKIQHIDLNMGPIGSLCKKDGDIFVKCLDSIIKFTNFRIEAQ